MGGVFAGKISLIMNRKDFLHVSGLVLAATLSDHSAWAFPPATPGTIPLPLAETPKDAGFDAERLALARQAVKEAVEEGVPGAVLLIGRKGKIALREAFGFAGVRPERAVSVDTIFDLASLTKCFATASSIMLLWEDGKLGLDDTAAAYLPAFKNAGDPKDKITIRQLLTHSSGLVAGGAYGGKTRTLPEMLQDIAASKQKAAPGTAFIYSDFSAVTLQGIVEAVSNQSLDTFAQTRLWGPLGMANTGYKPTGEYAARCAATTSGDDTPETRGVVHDPIARAMGGVAGNAGLFSCADDLATFCQMMLFGGIWDRVRIFQPETVALMTSGANSFDGKRALGWDLNSGYSIRGTLPDGSWGHTGFTGTSVWCDPQTGAFIVLLTNAVHVPGASSVVIPLRRRVSSLVAYALPELAAPLPPAVPDAKTAAQVTKVTGVRTGLDVLEAEFARFKNKSVGVVCNHTARDSSGNHIADVFIKGGVPVQTFFGPEHGIRGEVDASVGNSTDAKTGVPVVSLYNLQLPKAERYRPTKEQLAGLDTLIYDIQDIGARYYTYIATLGYCMEAAAKNNLQFIVLDRPNPLGGNLVEGPLLDKELMGNFTGYHNAPITHGMTVGELARMFNKERGINAHLEVIPMENWKRDVLFDQTGLSWVNPSPNIRSVTEAALYPGVGFLEVLPLSVGRGTGTPFEHFGAPWITAPELLAADLTARNLPGVAFAPTRFTPVSSKFAKMACGGVRVTLLDRAVYRPSEMGIHLADALTRRYPETMTPDVVATMRGMIGSKAICEAISAGVAPSKIIASWKNDVALWRERRAPFLLY